MHMEKEIAKVAVVACAVIKKDGKYLLVQEKQPIAYGLWGFPGGRVEIGDTIEQTAIKEAKEESGYDIELICKIDILQELATDAPKHFFEARIVGGELQYPDDEILDAQWFAFDEIKQMKEKLRGNWVIDAITLLKNKNL